jgi:hypothetical protein
VSFEFKEKLSQELGTVVARQLASARSQERYHVSSRASGERLLDIVHAQALSSDHHD